MDEQQLRELIRMFSQRMEMRGQSGDKSDNGQGDYQDFLANFMHAQNMGAQPGELSQMMGGFDNQRMKAMRDYAGGPTMSSDPTTQEARGSINQLMRNRGM